MWRRRARMRPAARCATPRSRPRTASLRAGIGPASGVGLGAEGELVLDRLRGEVHDRQRVRVRGRQVAREVDDPEQRAARGVVHRRGGTGPAVHGRRVVLGGEDLNGVVSRRARCPWRSFRPPTPTTPSRAGGAPREPAPRAPVGHRATGRAVDVADQRDVVGVANIVQESTQDWHGNRQWVLRPAPLNSSSSIETGARPLPGSSPASVDRSQERWITSRTGTSEARRCGCSPAIHTSCARARSSARRRRSSVASIATQSVIVPSV